MQITTAIFLINMVIASILVNFNMGAHCENARFRHVYARFCNQGFYFFSLTLPQKNLCSGHKVKN